MRKHLATAHLTLASLLAFGCLLAATGTRAETNDIGALKVSVFNFSGCNYIIRGASTLTVGPNLINIIGRRKCGGT